MILQHTRMFRPVFVLVAALGLGACAQNIDDTSYSQPASRAAPIDSALTAPSGGVSLAPASYSVVDVQVTVPETLKVSEANRYLPAGDIVWREDPLGDRYEQVRVIVDTALRQGVAEMNGPEAVVLEVVMQKFHALTEKARYTVGGVHAIKFSMQLRDAETGALVSEPKVVDASFAALGGKAAIQAESQGITQKVRITNHLSHMIQQELGSPNGYVAHNTGLIGTLNGI